MKAPRLINSIAQVHQAFGLAPPRHPLVSVVGAFDPARLEDIADTPIVSELYSISLKVGLTGSCLYGRNTYDYQDGTLVFIAPGQVVQYTAGGGVGDQSQSWNLLFHPDLIRRSELGRCIGAYSFFHYEANEALHVSEAEKACLKEIIDKIVSEYSANIDRHSQALIVSNIKLLLDYCTRYYDRQFHTRTNLNKDITSDFEQVLHRYYQRHQHEEHGLPTVAYCGKEMGISPYYLSDLLKKETGRTASDYIHFFVLERAKNSLLGTRQSVTEVAYNLGFIYPQHFSKLFKSKVGVSPREYRKLGRADENS